QTLHEVAERDRLGPAAMLAWLRAQRDDSADGAAERTRRLDSDAAAIQIVTVHASKGLQYPIVYLPFLFDRWIPPIDVPRFHAGSERVLDIGGPGSSTFNASQKIAKAEDCAEQLRLLYVAATRAQSQVVAWWAPTTNAANSGLTRLLFGRKPGEAAVPDFALPPSDEDAVKVLQDWQALGGPVVERVQPREATPVAGPVRLLYVGATGAPSQVVAWGGPPTNAANSGLTRLLFGRKHREPAVPDLALPPTDEDVVKLLQDWQALGGPVVERVLPREATAVAGPEETGELGVRVFDRVVDTAWRRTSYTGLTSEDDSHAATVGSEPPEIGTNDEQADDVVLPAGPGVDVPSPMADLPMGAAFGSLVHGVLERLDVTVPDLRAQLLALIDHEIGYWGVDVDPDVLADALIAVCRTPLGPLADELTLETLLASRQLRELDFELPLAGGDTPHARAAGREPLLGDLAALLEQHLPAGDPMRAFADRLRSPGLAAQGLRGYLSGSIDLGLRLPDGRVLVVDYKTNWLGDFEQPLTLDGYSPAGVTAAMNSGTYPLQSLLYSVVIHRFLRWRQAGYDPEKHLGGTLYLYVRGMAGPDAPRDDGQPFGVFAWHPPASLIIALSDLMDGLPTSSRGES
ncbi:MAG: 3'-5' exonuclease, partial [Aeromicrobium sp.]